MTRLLAFLLIGVFAFAPAYAEEAAPRPQAPYIAKLKDNTAWVIDIETKATAAPKDPKTGTPLPVRKQIVSNRCSGIRHELTLWSDGNKNDLWIAENYVFAGNTHGDYHAFALEPNSYPDFPELAWINAGNFKSITTKNGQQCFLYFWPYRAIPDSETRGNMPLEPTAVWISVDTKLPVAYENEHERGVFNFNVPSVAMVLPEACEKILKVIEADRNRINGQAMAPLPPPRE